MLKLINDNNMSVSFQIYKDGYKPDLIYADMIYEDTKLYWIDYYWNLLKLNGIFIVQTDFHTVAQVKLLLDRLGTFINWCIYIQEWGGVSKRYFPRKHDDILIYAKGDDYKFYPERIMIPKVTANTAFDKRGDGLKIPCDVFYDLGNFSTISKERVQYNSKNIQWQKPLKLMNRLLLPFTDEGDLVLDPFMGSGTTGVWCKQNNRNFIGIELDKEIFSIAEDRILNEK